MNPTTVEILKILGYPTSSILVLIVLGYLFRQIFVKILDKIVAKDLEILKNQNAQNLENTKKEYSLVLENKKAELAQETEKLKTFLSVEAETHRLAAQKRFEVLLKLWQSSESLLQNTDFSKIEAIRNSLSEIDEALSQLRKCSVLLSPEILKSIELYLKRILNVFTTTEKELQKNEVDKEKEEKIFHLATNVMMLANPIIGLITPMLIPSIKKELEKNRRISAENARTELENAIRKEFGIDIKNFSNINDGTNNRMQS